MDRIIRSKAVETSNQSNDLDTSELHLHLSFEMASIYGDSVASVSRVLPAASTRINLATVTTHSQAIPKTSNYSKSFCAFVHQPPSIFPYLVLFSSIAFFATVLVWAWTYKIEQVDHLQGKFISIGELHKFPQRNLSSLFSANIHAQNIPLVLVGSLPHQTVGLINQQDKIEIKLDDASDWNQALISGRVISIFPGEPIDEKLGLFDRVAVALDSNYAAGNKQDLTFLVGQTASAKIIHQSRIADILLQPIKQLHHS
jgi:hypothetical protein